jgi:hypothetical protein
MGRLIAGAFLVSAIALAGMTGAFAQGNATGGGHTNSGTGIGKLHQQQPVPPPPPPPPGGRSGTGIGKLHAQSIESPAGVQPGTITWTDGKRLRFYLRGGAGGHVFYVRHRTVIHVGHRRVGIY